MGGGGFSMEPQNPALDDYILGLAHAPVPKICLLPTASGDPNEQIASFHAFASEVGEVDLPPGRFALLTLIGRNPGISQTELSQANGRDKSSLTPVVEDLVRRGLVERKRMDSDRRAYSLNVTPAGKKVLTMMTRCARRHERNLDHVIGERDRKRFIQILKRIAAEIE